MNALIPLCAAVLTVGCANSMHYVNAEGQEMPRQTLLECEYEATKATAGITGMVQSAYMFGEVKRRCFDLRGYTLQRRPG